MKNGHFTYAVQDNEQDYANGYVYEVSVVGCNVYHSTAGRCTAKMNCPAKNQKITWWIDEVARELEKPFEGRKSDVVWCDTWDDFVDRYAEWFVDFSPKYLFAHSMANDAEFWRRTHRRFGRTRRINVNADVATLFRFGAWHACNKICSQYMFDKDVSPKTCERLRTIGPGRVRVEKSSLEYLMQCYTNDRSYRQSHTSMGDAYDLYRLIRMRMALDGTRVEDAITTRPLRAVSIV